jgi:hypothetical protein
MNIMLCIKFCIDPARGIVSIEKMSSITVDAIREWLLPMLIENTWGPTPAGPRAQPQKEFGGPLTNKFRQENQNKNKIWKNQLMRSRRMGFSQANGCFQES